jgi:hypothetical protein
MPEGPAIFHGIPAVPNRAAPTQPHFNEMWLSKPDRKDVQHIKVGLENFHVVWTDIPFVIRPAPLESCSRFYSKNAKR